MDAGGLVLREEECRVDFLDILAEEINNQGKCEGLAGVWATEECVEAREDLAERCD